MTSTTNNKDDEEAVVGGAGVLKTNTEASIPPTSNNGLLVVVKTGGCCGDEPLAPQTKLISIGADGSALVDAGADSNNQSKQHCCSQRHRRRQCLARATLVTLALITAIGVGIVLGGYLMIGTTTGDCTSMQGLFI